MCILKKQIVLVCILLASLSASFAQPGSNPGGGVKPGVPITGIEILIAIGGLVGLKKIINSRKKN
jgi:hypothetical protein